MKIRHYNNQKQKLEPSNHKNDRVNLEIDLSDFELHESTKKVKVKVIKSKKEDKNSLF